MDNVARIGMFTPPTKVNSPTPIIFSIIMNAFFIILAIILIAMNFKKVMNLDLFQRLILLYVSAGMVGFHGLLHTAMGFVYGENLIKIPYVMTIPL
jgi:hypothetical protein